MLANALARGMGRAVVVLETAGSDRMPADRETILYACLNDQRWDRQLETSRARYLFDVLHATGEPQWYAAELQRALLDETTECTRYQVFELATLLVRGGIEWLRPAIHAAFASAAAAGYDIGAEELIALEGAAGYRRIVRTFTISPLLEDEDWMPRYLLGTLIARDGEETARLLTRQMLRDEPETRPYLESAWKGRKVARKTQAVYKEERQKSRGLVSYVTIAADIALPTRAHRFVRNKIDDATLLRLAEDLNAEVDPERLVKYLRHFHWRTFPLPPDRLIELARGETEDPLTLRALSALENVFHPDVHALAREFIGTPGSEWRGVGLLNRNPVAGDDYALLISLLAQPEKRDEWEYHRIGISAKCYAETHPSPDACDLLILLYENGPCSMCRRHAVELLRKMDASPPWVEREFAYDAGR